MLILSNNTAAVAYLNNKGGIRSLGLQRVAASIFSWAELCVLSLSTVDLKGTLNVVADFLSKRPVYQDEWALQRAVFQGIVNRWGTPDVDLFAIRDNVNVNRFCSLVRSLALGPDWLTIHGHFPWDMLFCLSALLRKFCQEQKYLILAVTFWPRRPWFALLHSLARDSP